MCERMRVDITKHYSRQLLTASERLTVKHKYGDNCTNCECQLEEGSWGSDHIVALWQGGEDTMDNQEPLCLSCHSQQSEHERLYQGTRKTIESTFARQVLGMFFAAPKPQQLVFGDGVACPFEVDQIGARRNAVLQNEHRLPIVTVLDEILVANWHDVAGPRHDEIVTLSDETDNDILYALEYVSQTMNLTRISGL